MHKTYGQIITGRKRVIIAPGGGFQEKCWGDHNFNRLIDLLVKEKVRNFCNWIN